jgi:bacteriorhodopsin
VNLTITEEDGFPITHTDSIGDALWILCALAAIRSTEAGRWHVLVVCRYGLTVALSWGLMRTHAPVSARYAHATPIVIPVQRWT